MSEVNGLFVLRQPSDRAALESIVRYNRDVAHHVSEFTQVDKGNNDSAVEQYALELFHTLYIPVFPMYSAQGFQYIKEKVNLCYTQWQELDRLYASRENGTLFDDEVFDSIVDFIVGDDANNANGLFWLGKREWVEITRFCGTSFIDKERLTNGISFSEIAAAQISYRFLLFNVTGEEFAELWNNFAHNADSGNTMLRIAVELISSGHRLKKSTTQEQSEKLATLCAHVNNGHMDVDMPVLIRLLGEDGFETDNTLAQIGLGLNVHNGYNSDMMERFMVDSAVAR